MKRITPEEVIKAYEETGLTPKPGLLYRPYQHAACAIGVLTYHELSKKEEFDPPAYIHWSHVEDNLGYHYDYCISLALGFDNPNDQPDPTDSDSDHILQAFADGVAIHKAVKERFPNFPK